MRGVFLFLLLSLISISSIEASEELTLEQLKDISKTPQVLQGDFIQEKYLQKLDTTLVSSGRFVYQRGKVIHWEILQPIQHEFIMTPTEIVNKQAEHELLRLEKNTSPIVAVFGDIFFSILAAEWGKLSDYFRLTGKVEGKKWQVELVPLDKNILQVISRVELKGGDLLYEIVMHENGGGITTIHFTNLEGNQQ